MPLGCGLWIFREVWVLWQGYPNVAIICRSRVAPVAEKAHGVCFPTDAVQAQPDHEPAPDDCEQWQRSGSSVQTARVCAGVVFPIGATVCQSDSPALGQS